ncbi:acyl carrier protein [Clostridium folliculivorans]|uniref:Acyl carrier protein n=1 Tax=Clostridium folliculivorans TaxID=2886038 RepID=A0A9W5Y328_9CLOT|nr:acyl carrier protein [Clostridium folliculivorans]GKU25708.1 acyl carrier protein [Clostridium folliculivorans]GKU28730.1 acyl carrier protein [Clostridium folliculivorans]
MVLEKIKEVIVEQLGVDADAITLATTFQEDLGADSLDLFQIIMDLEEEFNVKIEDVEAIKTVGDAVTYIEERV